MPSTRFEGVCYDGPWEGQQLSHDRPWYRIALQPALYLTDPLLSHDDLLKPPDIKLAAYVWQRDLRKWVFDPRG